MIRINVDVDLNIDEIMKKMDRAKEKAQFILDQQVVKDSNFFIPKDTSDLEGSALTHTVFGSGEVTWQTPYARRLYYNPQYDFSKDSNPNAQGLWFEAAKALHVHDWTRLMQEVYDEEFKR
ncbi:minor capsid protein [Lysinibacillus sp. RS5]|uniref:minor capsid protein n=1 Tax=unclassified Lysinibacillus TaxID=2636778 RepID=UPI0035BE8D4B